MPLPNTIECPEKKNPCQRKRVVGQCGSIDPTSITGRYIILFDLQALHSKTLFLKTSDTCGA